MAVRSIHRASGTAGLRAVAPHAVDIVADSAESDRLKFKDSSGTVRTVMDSSMGLKEPITDYAADGAIAIVPGIVTLSKGSAGAYTLAAPTTAQNGTRLTITSTTAFAHVITATDLLHDGITGGAKDTATFAAFAGATLELIAVNQKWHVVAKNVVTIAAV